MGILVQKYGGSSLATVEQFKNVARNIVKAKKEGNSVVVVVSALGDTTNELLKKAYEISPHPSDRETDVLLATGEQMSAALLTMAIQALGQEAISFSGPQVGIVTDTAHTQAKIVDVKSKHILEQIKAGRIVIVAGFQGVTVDNDVTTLGRGGSDTTAIALAAKLGADICEIYTDVEGVYTADPKLVPEARLLSVVSYEEMLEMAATGAKILQLRAVECARNYNVLIHVRSSFSEAKGTLVKGVDELMEKPIISGVTHDTGEAKITIFGVPDRPGVAARVFKTLAEAGINVDMIIQNVSEKGTTDISFTASKDILDKTRKVVEGIVKELGARGSAYDINIAKISLVGAGMKTHPGVAADMFGALAESNINIQMISTSPIKIACIVEARHVEKAVRALHEKFNLAKETFSGEKV